MRIAINGFGRIGRLVYRLLVNRTDLNVVAINNPYEGETMAHLLKYDTIHGAMKEDVQWDGKILKVGKQTSVMSYELDPANCKWKELDVDLVLECSGKFLTREKSSQHLKAGAKRIILSAPPKDEDIPTLVMGVNHQQFKKTDTIISCASCTTNCVAPVLRVMVDHFGFEVGSFTTVHSYTNDQRLLDFSHKDLRRARAAFQNMIPTSTGAHKSAGLVIPEVKGKLHGLSIRVPTPNVSLVDLVFRSQKPLSTESVNKALEEASKTDRYKGILQYIDEELVSSDFNGSTYSSVVDSLLTKAISDRDVKIIAWYDNETGFSARMVDLAHYVLTHS